MCPAFVLRSTILDRCRPDGGIRRALGRSQRLEAGSQARTKPVAGQFHKVVVEMEGGGATGAPSRIAPSGPMRGRGQLHRVER